MQVLLVFLSLAVLLLPGYVLLKRYSKLKELEVISLAPVISILVYGAIFYPLHVFFGWNVSSRIVLAILTVSTLFFVISRLKFEKKEVPRSLVLIVIIAFLVRLLMLQFEPEPRVGDSIQQFMPAKSFLEGKWYYTNFLESFWDPLTSVNPPYPASHRPPLNAFAVSLILSFSTTYNTAQIFETLIGSLIALPAWLIAKEIIGRKYAQVAVILIAFNPVLVDYSLQVSPKILMAYAALVFIYFYIKSPKFENWVWMGAAATAALLSHYSFVAMIAAVLLYHLIFCFDKKHLKNIFKMFLLLTLLLTPWLVRNYLVFGAPLYSNSQYWFMQNQVEYDRLEPPTPSGYFAQPILKIALDKLGSVLNTFAPIAGTVRDLLFQHSFDFNDFKKRFLYDTCVNSSLFCVLTPPLFILMVAGFFWADRFSKIVGVYISVGLAMGTVFLGFNAPGGHLSEFLLPVVPLAIVSSLNYASKKFNARQFIMIAKASVLLTVLFLAYVFYINHFSERYGYRYPIVLKTANDPALFWLKTNSREDSVVMSPLPLATNYYTLRPSIAIPFETNIRIEQTIKKYNVQYLLLPKGLYLENRNMSYFTNKYPILLESQKFLILKVV